MPDEPLLFLLLDEAPHVEVVEEVRPPLPQVVQQVEIDVSGPRLPQRGLELRHGVLAGPAFEPRGVLGGQLELLPGIALHQRLADRVLAARVGPGSVEVGKALGQKAIHHPLRLLDVDSVALLGQTHQAEPQLLDPFPQMSHRIPLVPRPHEISSARTPDKNCGRLSPRRSPGSPIHRYESRA